MYQNTRLSTTVIHVLFDAEQPLTQCQLAGLCQVSITQLAPVLDALVKAGHVERIDDVVRLQALGIDPRFRPSLYQIAPAKLAVRELSMRQGG